MRKIRVLHITPSVRLLGARRSLLTLVSSLAGGAIEPLVLAPAEGGLTEELDKRKLPWLKLRLPPWRKANSWLGMPGRVAALRALCEERQIDLVHCNEIYPNPHAVAACSGGAVLSNCLSRIVAGCGSGRLLRPVVTHMRLSVTPRMATNYFLGDATRIIAVSNGAASDFDSFPWKQARVRVIHNGIELDEFDEARRRRDMVRHRMGLRDDDFLIGSIGLMMPRKRPRFVIEAAPAIRSAVPNVQFLFVGEASPGQESYVEELQSLARDLGVSDCVHFVPFQKNVAEYFAALDVNLLISNDEGFGRVVLEAAGAHVPTVGSNVGGIPELIEDGATGYLLGSADAPDEEFEREKPRFVEIMRELAGDAAKRKALGDAAYERANARFSVDQYVSGCAGVFREAIAEFQAK